MTSDLCSISNTLAYQDQVTTNRDIDGSLGDVKSQNFVRNTFDRGPGSFWWLDVKGKQCHFGGVITKSKNNEEEIQAMIHFIDLLCRQGYKASL